MLCTFLDKISYLFTKSYPWRTLSSLLSEEIRSRISETSITRDHNTTLPFPLLTRAERKSHGVYWVNPLPRPSGRATPALSRLYCNTVLLMMPSVPKAFLYRGQYSQDRDEIKHWIELLWWFKNAPSPFPHPFLSVSAGTMSALRQIKNQVPAISHWYHCLLHHTAASILPSYI